MILFVANNDLELLALRAAVESLPEGSPVVRAYGGVGLEEQGVLPDLDGVRLVLVRLHKGRGAWRDAFDELRRRCMARGVALLAFGARLPPMPGSPPCPPCRRASSPKPSPT